MTSMKKSHGWNSSPTIASWGANNTSNIADMMPPQKEDQTPMPRARPGSPARAIGKPSKVVATEDGVPGMPVKMPDIRPPERPPTKTEIIVASPCAGGIEKVKGSVKTIAIAMVKPGIEPAINPAPTPMTI